MKGKLIRKITAVTLAIATAFTLGGCSSEKK